MLSEFIRGTRRWGLKTAWFNLRFQLGYWIGGFTHASNYRPGEDPADESTWYAL